MFLDLWIGQLAPKRFQPFVRSLLIRSHQARVARHIRGENGSQPAFEASRGQSGAPQPHGPNRLSALSAHSNGKREGWHSLFGGRPPPISSIDRMHRPRWSYVLGSAHSRSHCVSNISHTGQNRPKSAPTDISSENCDLLVARQFRRTAARVYPCCALCRQ